MYLFFFSLGHKEYIFVSILYQAVYILCKKMNFCIFAEFEYIKAF